MKKVIGGIALILSLAGLGYSGFTIYGATKGAKTQSRPKNTPW